MREPGRSDAGGDARPDRTDVLTAAEAGDAGVPADGGGTALPHASDQIPDVAPEGASDQTDAAAIDAAATDPPAAVSPAPPDGPAPPADENAGTPDAAEDDEPGADDPDAVLDGDLDSELDVPDFPGDDVLFDPLLSDEPIDLAAVRADDALIDALGGGDFDAARDLIDVDDPLIAMLAAWAASTRPDEEPEPERSRPPLRLVGTPGAEAGDETGGTAGDPTGPADPATDAPAELDPATTAPAALDPTAHEATADVTDDPAPAVATTAVGPVRRLVPAPVLGVLDRARVARRRTTPEGRPLPAGHPLRRAAVAVVVAALAVSAAAAAGGTARPGEAGFAMTRVFFAERAESLEAAQVVAEGLERARTYIAQRQPALAAQELADVENKLPDVRDEEGHTQLVGQQEALAAAVALTPQAPPEPSRSGPTSKDPDPGTSILAEAAPPATVPDATVPDTTPRAADVVAPPSQDVASGEASTPGADSAAPGAAGTSGTPPEVATSTVSGVTDVGTVTADPTPTSGTSGTDTTTVTATSEPTGPTSTTSVTTAPTTSSSTPAPSTSTSATADDGDGVATGSVPVGGSPIVVRPASHHEALDGAGTGPEPAGAGDATPAPEPAGAPGPTGDVHETHAAGSVTAASADDAGSPLPVVRAVVPAPVAHRSPVVITTVPRPARAAGAASDDAKPASDRSGHDRRRAVAHRSPGGAAPAGARLSGAGEIRLRSDAD